MSKLKYLSFGIEVINYPQRELPISNPSGNEKYYFITTEADREIKQIVETIQKKRGQFISGCIDIENLMTEAISHYFFENDLEKKELFCNLILDANILDFKRKEMLLESLMVKYPEKFSLITVKERQEMIETIDDLIKKRNGFAHGKIEIDYQTNTTDLIYYDRGQKKNTSLHLSNELFSDLQKKIVYTCEYLSRLFPSDCATSITLECIRIDKLE